MAPRKSHGCLTIDDEESLVTLRHYELDAYASVVTALRAEGNINEKKKAVLKELREILGISMERHKSEVRRAANDDSLSKVAREIQGVSCDDDWQNEGRRLVGRIKHPLPITAYTRIADEVAESLLNEQNRTSVPDSSSSKEKKQRAKVVHPPENPQHILNSEIFGDITKLTEEAAMDTSPSHPDEDDEEESTRQDFLDSYVFLPGGTVVKVEPKSKQRRSRAQVSTSRPHNKAVSPKKHTALISSEPVTHDTPQVKPLPTIDNDKADFEKQDVVKDAPKRSFPFQQQSQQNPDSLRQKVPKRREYYERPSSHQLDHIYSSGSSPRGQYLSHSLNSNWATKDTAAAEAKARRRMQRSAISNSKKLSRSMNASTRRLSPTDRRARISSTQQRISSPNRKSTLQDTSVSPSKQVSIYPKPTPTVRQGYPQAPPYQYTHEDYRSESTPQLPYSSPQKVFRPTMSMTSPPVEKSALTSQDLFASAPHHIRCSVEAGLAPVSTIVSQVASKTDTPPPTNPNLSSAREQHMKISQGHVAVAPSRPVEENLHSPIRAAPAMSGQKPALTAAPNTSNANDVDVDIPNTFTASVVKRSETTAKRSQPSITVSVQPSTPQVVSSILPVKQTAPTTLITSAKPRLSNSAIPQLESAPPASALKVPTSVSRVPSVVTSASGHVTGTVMPALSHISTANIIKVTPRPLASVSKGSQIVTQIAGTRITKAFNSGGNTKPSIIVVRQAPRKAVATAPTKVVDREGTTISLPRLKTMSTVTSSLKPTTILRPVSAKVSVRDSSSMVTSSAHEQTSSGTMHKVITKGKMRQLVLKPTPTSILRQSSQDLPGMLSAFASRVPPELRMGEDTPEAAAASSTHTASTMKALAAMPKNPLIFTGVSGTTFDPSTSKNPLPPSTQT